jgi:AcrR family transcriptional regulator
MDNPVFLTHHLPITKAKSRPDRKQPRRSAVVKQLNRESIVAAALAEIDSNGVDDFNLRSLAKRLGVYPTAIYWHVPTKYDILAEVVGAVFRGVAPPRNRLDWRDVRRVATVIKAGKVFNPRAIEAALGITD